MTDTKISEFFDKAVVLRSQIITDTLNDFMTLFCSVENECKNLQKSKAIYGINKRETFNFFEPINKYWREDFHDIVISQILDPSTKEIGDIEYLRIFCSELCGMTNFPFDDTVTVEKQAGRIDILISDRNNAIIFESKINGARDQQNQLARYYDYVTNKLKKKVLGIVYLRHLRDENKLPPFADYSPEYKDKTVLIQKLLIPIPVLDSKSENDLCHRFLDKCSEKSKKITAKIYIQQYSDLLKNLGGKSMIMNIEKELFTKLFGDATSIQMMMDIAQIWNDRYNLLYDILSKKLIEEGCFFYEDDQIRKDIDDDIFIFFELEYPDNVEGCRFLFGVESQKDKISKNIKKKFDQILRCQEYSFILSDIDCNESWCFGVYLKEKLLGPIDEVFKDLLGNYRILEEKVRKVLDE
jgi:hypothetical protein